MKKLFGFEHEFMRSVPMGLLGAVGIFFLTLLLESVFGAVFYSLSYYGFKNQPFMASVVINLGLWATKIFVLLTIFKLAVRTGEPDAPSPFKHWVKSHQIKRFVLMTMALVFFFRMGYDSLIGSVIVNQFGIDQDLKESFELILGAPILGIFYIIVIAPIFEEILYRGIIFGGLRRKGQSFVFSAYLSALLFGLMHMNVSQGINAFVLGLLAAYVYEQTGNLKISIGLHLLNNLYVTLGGYWMEGLYEKIPTIGRLGFTIVGIGCVFWLLRRLNQKAEHFNSLE